MILAFIASACLALMAFLIGVTLTEFTDAFWNGLDNAGTRIKKFARARRASRKASYRAMHTKHTGR